VLLVLLAILAGLLLVRLAVAVVPWLFAERSASAHRLGAGVATILAPNDYRYWRRS
jgi:hypothetical protein